MFKSWFTPSPRFRLQMSQYAVEILPSQTLLESALKHGMQIPHGCHAGGCGLCKCRLLSGNVKQKPEVLALLTTKEKQDGVIYACCSWPLSDVKIELIKE